MPDSVTARVTALISYPIKGCAGVPTSEAVLTPAGLPHDRSFMVADPEGGFRSQRRDPRLATIRPELSPDGTRLKLHAPLAEPVPVAVSLDGARRDVWLFGTRYQGIDQGDAAAAWLSRVLGAPRRLVRVPPDHDRRTGGDTPGTSGYADSCPVHLVSQSSVDLLNAQIAAHGGRPVPVDRFRPNLVVAGWPEPHTEDRVRRITIGGAELGFAKRAIRCVVVTIEQTTGQKAGPEPLRTLAGYRRVGDGVAFGANFAVTRPGRLAVGDEVEVTVPEGLSLAPARMG